MKWDLDSPVSFKSDGRTVHDYDRRFEAEEKYGIPTDHKFKWKMVDEAYEQAETGDSGV